MNHLKLNQSKVHELVSSLKQLLTDYQLYRQKLNVFLEKGNYKYFKDFHQHVEALYNNTNKDMKDIVSRIQILSYSPTIEFKKLPRFIENRLFHDARNVMLMTASIINTHNVLVGNMKNVIHNAAAANDRHTNNLINRVQDFLEIQSWILGLWSDMYTEILSQRFIKHRSKLNTDTLGFRWQDLVSSLSFK